MTQRSTARILRLLKTKGALNAATLAKHLKVTPVAARQHLAALLQRGLVSPEDRKLGVGRPKRFWSLTKAGHEYFPENHAGLTLDLIAAVRAVFGEAGLDRVIRHREGKARQHYRSVVGDGSMAERAKRLAAQRSAEGYMAGTQALPDGGVLLVERHCPICAAAATCQGFCRAELALFADAMGPDVSVTRTDHIVSGAERCAYILKSR